MERVKSFIKEQKVMLLTLANPAFGIDGTPNKNLAALIMEMAGQKRTVTQNFFLTSPTHETTARIWATSIAKQLEVDYQTTDKNYLIYVEGKKPEEANKILVKAHFDFLAEQAKKKAQITLYQYQVVVNGQTYFNWQPYKEREEVQEETGFEGMDGGSQQ